MVRGKEQRPRRQKREVKVRVAGNSALARFFLGPFGRILIVELALLRDPGLSARSPTSTPSTRGSSTRS